MSTSNPSGRQYQLGTMDKEALRAKSHVTVTAHNLVKMEQEEKIRRLREAERKLKGALESKGKSIKLLLELLDSYQLRAEDDLKELRQLRRKEGGFKRLWLEEMSKSQDDTSRSNGVNRKALGLRGQLAGFRRELEVARAELLSANRTTTKIRTELSATKCHLSTIDDEMMDLKLANVREAGPLKDLVCENARLADELQVATTQRDTLRQSSTRRMDETHILERRNDLHINLLGRFTEALVSSYEEKQKLQSRGALLLQDINRLNQDKFTGIAHLNQLQSQNDDLRSEKTKLRSELAESRQALKTESEKHKEAKDTVLETSKQHENLSRDFDILVGNVEATLDDFARHGLRLSNTMVLHPQARDKWPLPWLDWNNSAVSANRAPILEQGELRAIHFRILVQLHKPLVTLSLLLSVWRALETETFELPADMLLLSLCTLEEVMSRAPPASVTTLVSNLLTRKFLTLCQTPKPNDLPGEKTG
ncbi:hypothetical protein PV05_09427 [Exophiala xenobiotica]|uniref:Uncharacterized protein n=1 Tax=Exophiala xenobiotica TaxID=348802 RepID=A0A0D2BEK1_9EURO|nr:uncharacterized protein PV05_09427 [Exophiala xenobiotica]KIW50636.1 hypothetical protein PV05_09427 [Exophiala xenobiotica]